jgi:hypothetical protein
MKSLFKILLVMAIFICLPTNAFSPGENIKRPIIENSMADSFIVKPLHINCVYLSMEKENSNFKINFEESGNIDFRCMQNDFINDSAKALNHKKEKLLEVRVKEFLPDFVISDLEKPNFNKIYSFLDGNETHFFLKNNYDKEKSDIRIITFIRKENPMQINSSSGNYSISITTEESYY